jgi:hypothetical protein
MNRERWTDTHRNKQETKQNTETNTKKFQVQEQ